MELYTLQKQIVTNVCGVHSLYFRETYTSRGVWTHDLEFECMNHAPYRGLLKRDYKFGLGAEYVGWVIKVQIEINLKIYVNEIEP